VSASARQTGATSGPFRAVIFDMDGVIADSEPTYREAINLVLAPTGHRMSEQQYEEVIGTSVRFTWRTILETFAIEGDIEDYVRRYARALIELLRRPLPPLPGVRELLAELRRRSLPAALATSSWKRWAEALLQATGLDGAFDAVVWREMAERPKPAPDLFLRAAELVAVEPARCIVLEDTAPGLEAARAAGMLAVQVRSASTALPPQPHADLVLESLKDFPLSLLVKA
jgi:HAD superfamily hydrolase (TIGR01509 family)